MEEKFKVGNFLSQLRKEQKLTQAELAEKLNVSDKAVSKWENGRCLPETQQLKELSKLYHITIDELLYGERVKNPSSIHEQVSVENYNKLLEQSKALKFSLICLSLLFVLNFLSLVFIYLKLSFVFIYSCVLFAISVIIMLAISNKYKKVYGKTKQTNIDNDKLKKSKKLNKIGLIISLTLSLLLIVLEIASLVIVGTSDFAIVMGNITFPVWISIIIYLLWSFSIVPAIMYVIMAFKNPYFTGWMVGNFIGIGWGALLLVLLPAPIFMIAYYYNSIKLFRLK